MKAIRDVDLNDTPWIVKTKFKPGEKITERIWMLIKASGLVQYEHLDTNIHEEVKDFPYLVRIIFNENSVPTPSILYDCYASTQEFVKELSRHYRPQVYTKREVEKALIKIIKNGI